MALNSKVAIDIQIKNVKKITDLKNSLKNLRKEQRDIEKATKDGNKSQSISSKRYKENSKAIDGQSKSLRTLNRGQKDAAKSSNSLSKSFIKAAAAIAVVVGAFRLVSRAIGSVVSTFTEFEFVMAKVNAVSGATASEFKSLTKSAEDLGRSTFFTATQVGELQLAYSKLGFTAQEILDATEATLDLATATGTDLARAAQVAGASIRGFQLDASEAGRVVDVMAVAFSSSALDIEKWNTSMTKVAPIAAMAGFEIEEVAAIMGKLSDTGIEASIAGTSLRNIFLKMQDPSSKLSKTLGHTITNLDEMLIAFKGLQDEGTDLTDVLGFMDIRQVAAFSTMLEGSDDIAVLRDNLLLATGEGDRMADMVGDTLQGAFLKFKSAVEGVAISIMKNFGKSLTKTVVRLSKLMNSFVANEKSVKKFTDTLIFLGVAIKKGIALFLSYKVGIIAAGVASKVMTAYLYLQTFGTEALTLVTGKATVAMQSFGRSMVKTGIGILVLALIDLAYSMATFNESAQDAIDFTGGVSKAASNLESKIKTLDEWERKLIESRKKQNQLLNSEGKLMVKSAENAFKLKEAKNVEARAIQNLNKELKLEGEELISVKTKTDDVLKSMNALTKKVGENALAKIFLEQESIVIKTKVNAEQAMSELNKAMGGGKSDEAIIGLVKKLKSVQGGFGMWMHEIVSFFRGDTPVEKANKIILGIMDKYSLTLGTLIDASGGNYIEKQTTLLTDSINKAASNLDIGDFKLEDALADLEPKGKEEKKDKKNAQFEMNEKIAIRKEALSKLVLTEKEYQKALLQANIDGVQDYLDQENNKKEGIIAANIKMTDLLRKQNADIEADKLQNLRDGAKEELIIARENYIDKIDSLVQYQNNVNKINKELLEAEYKLLDEEQKLGKEGLAIQDKLLTLEANNKKNALAESERLIKKDFNDKVLALELEQSTTMMNKIEFDNRMLELEFDFLMARKGLYETGALELIDINNGILANNVSVNEAQKQLMQEQISAYGGVGSALTSLAGDNEKLNAVKEAGNAISQAANVISTVMALKENLITLGLVKSTAAQVASTAATVTDNTVTAAGLPIKATDTVLSSAKGLGPFGIIAMIAMAAMVMKVMRMKFEHGGVIDGENKFANGGMVHGASHAQGGVKFAVGGRVNELEGGEAVINKRSTAMFKNQLSSMNQAGGGVKFADGGLMSSPAFSEAQFNANNQSQMIGAMSGQRKVVVVESDITNSQSTVSVIQANATF
jgi:TP901 family phage tail tape measure protein